MTLRRHLTPLATLGLIAALHLSTAAAVAADWREKYPTINFGVLTLENQMTTVDRYKPYTAYAEKKLGVKVKLFQASDFTGVGQALTAGHLQMARIGGSGYAQAYLDCNGCVEPLVTTEGLDGTRGYYSILIVKAESPYKTLDDLRGKSVAFADPVSTSGYIIPMVSLNKAGIDANKFFSSTTFSGGHEQSTLAVLKGTYDSAFTWTSEGDSFGNLRMMMDKGLLKRDQVRVVWKSDLVMNPLLAVRKELPEQMKKDIAQMYLDMERESKEVLFAAGQGEVKRYVTVTHVDYEPMVQAAIFLRDARKTRR